VVDEADKIAITAFPSHCWGNSERFGVEYGKHLNWKYALPRCGGPTLEENKVNKKIWFENVNNGRRKILLKREGGVWNGSHNYEMIKLVISYL
jgi:hypothetical protein